MEFLDSIFLDNTVRSYLITAGTILAVLLLKRFVSRYIAGLMYHLLRKIWGNVEKKYFIDLVVQPIEFFVTVVVTVFAIDQLNFPVAWKYTIYGIKTWILAEKTGTTVIIIAFVWLLLRLVDFIAMVLESKASLNDDQSDNQLIVFFRDFSKVLFAIGGFLAILKFSFSQPIGPLVAGLGIAGAGIALASKESLENIIASFIIFFDKPFTTGDTVKVQDFSGTIEKIGLRSTRIRTPDKTLISVPNKQMVDSIVDNHTMRTQWRTQVQLQLNPHTPAAMLETLVQQITAALKQFEQINSSSVYIKEISKAGITITTEYFCQPMPAAAFEGVKQQMNLSIKKILEENKIVFAF